VLPEFVSGLLPEGVYVASWQEFRTRFGSNSHRRGILIGIREAGRVLARAGCSRMWIDGSFVTQKKRPSDWDGCWDPSGVNSLLLESFFLDFTDAGRTKMKTKYQADLFPSSLVEANSGLAFVNYFQVDKRSGARKGIVELTLTGWNQ